MLKAAALVVALVVSATLACTELPVTVEIPAYTQTPQPTHTPYPIWTPAPTWTPVPTVTPTLTLQPTPTPEPTTTRTPAPAPKPTPALEPTATHIGGETNWGGGDSSYTQIWNDKWVEFTEKPQVCNGVLRFKGIPKDGASVIYGADDFSPFGLYREVELAPRPGFTVDIVPPIAAFVEPPSGNAYYPSLDAEHIVASVLRTSGSGEFRLVAEWPEWLPDPGKVALGVWGYLPDYGKDNLRLVGVETCNEQSLEITSTPLPTPALQPVVRVIYAIPADREHDMRYEAAIHDAIVHAQDWYAEQLDGRTFAIKDPTPLICEVENSSKHYEGTDGWFRVIGAVQHCAPVQHWSDEYVWAIYIDAEFDCDGGGELGRGDAGVTIIHGGDLEGLLNPAIFSLCPGYPPRGQYGWIGGLAHELGHAFGLKHPPGCDEGLSHCDTDALMWLGFYWDYPETYFTDEDIDILKSSPFISLGAN